jgi:hypothetical protein
VGEATVQ